MLDTLAHLVCTAALALLAGVIVKMIGGNDLATWLAMGAVAMLAAYRLRVSVQ